LGKASRKKRRRVIKSATAELTYSQQRHAADLWNAATGHAQRLHSGYAKSRPKAAPSQSAHPDRAEIIVAALLPRVKKIQDETYQPGPESMPARLAVGQNDSRRGREKVEILNAGQVQFRVRTCRRPRWIVDFSGFDRFFPTPRTLCAPGN